MTRKLLGRPESRICLVGERPDPRVDLRGAFRVAPKVFESGGNPQAAMGLESVEMIDAVERGDCSDGSDSAPGEDDLLDARPTFHHFDGQSSCGIGLPDGKQDECAHRERGAEILGVFHLARAGQGLLRVVERAVGIAAGEMHERANVAILILLVVRGARLDLGEELACRLHGVTPAPTPVRVLGAMPAKEAEPALDPQSFGLTETFGVDGDTTREITRHRGQNRKVEVAACALR